MNAVTTIRKDASAAYLLEQYNALVDRLRSGDATLSSGVSAPRVDMLTLARVLREGSGEFDIVHTYTPDTTG